MHGGYRAARAFLRWYEAETEPKDWPNPIAKVREPRVREEPLEPVNLKLTIRSWASLGGAGVPHLEHPMRGLPQGLDQHG